MQSSNKAEGSFDIPEHALSACCDSFVEVEMTGETITKATCTKCLQPCMLQGEKELVGKGIRNLSRHVKVIVTCPKAFRCFEPATGRMYYEKELIEMGIAMTPTGKLVWVMGENAGREATTLIPLWNTSQSDDGGNPLYEGDICEVSIETGLGSLMPRIAIMRWSAQFNNFSLHFNGRETFAGGVTIRECKRIGNEYQNKEAAERFHKDNE